MSVNGGAHGAYRRDVLTSRRRACLRARQRGDRFHVIEQRPIQHGDETAVAGGGLEAVLHAVGDAITVQDRTGRITYANAAAAELIGFPDAASLMAAAPGEVVERFELLDDDGNALSLDALPGRAALRGEATPPRTVRFRIRATGEERWSIIRATPLVGPDGQITHAINAFQDVTARVLAEREAREAAARYRSVIESLPVVAWTTDPDGLLQGANARWWEYTGQIPEPGGPVLLGDAVHPDDRELLTASWARAIVNGSPLDETIRLRRADGADRWHLVRAVPVTDERGVITSWIGTSTDIDDAKRAEERSHLIAVASERLDESLDLEETVKSAAAIAVPSLADICVIDLLADDGTTRRAAIAVGDPEHGALADRLMAYPSVPGSPGLMGEVIGTGRTAVIEHIDDSALAARTKDDEHAAILRELGSRTAIAVPLVARGTTLGAIALIQAWSGRSFGPADVSLAEELARRAGLALANARLYTAEQEARLAAERERDRTQRLQWLAGRLAETSTTDGAASLVLSVAREALGAVAGSIYRLDASEQTMQVVTTNGYPQEAVAGFETVAVTADIPLAETVRTGEPVWIPDLQTLHGRTAEIDRALELGGNRAAVALPLRTEGRVLGALGLSFRDARTFPQSEREFILALTELAAQGIERTELGAARTELLLALDAQRARLAAVLEQAPVGVILAEAPSGRLILDNAQVERILGVPFAAGTTDSDVQVLPITRPEDGGPLEPDRWPLTRALGGEVVEAEELGFHRPDGSRGTLLSWAAPIRDRDGSISAAVIAFTDITERLTGQENQRYLAEASEVLGSSLDYEETLRRVAGLAVPRIADWVTVDLVDETGELTQIVVAHADPAKVELARQWRERYPPVKDSPQGAYAIARTGRSELMSDIPPSLLEAVTRDDPERAAIVQGLQLRSYMGVPLRSGDRILGVISFIGAESGRRFRPDDVTFAESLAARAAAAIENARLFRDADRFRRLLDATLDVVLVIDPATLRIRYANRGAAIATGTSVETLTGAQLESILPDLGAARLRALVEPLASGEADVRTVTLGLQGHSGITPVEVLFQRIGIAGEPDRIIALARDISDRIEAQARLQRLAESEHARAAELDAVIHAMGEAVFVCGADGTIVLANPAAVDLFPDVEERSYAELLAQLDDPTDLAPDLGTRGGPVELRAAGEDERWIELATYPVAGRAGTDPEVETIVVLRDVTEGRQRQAVRDTFVGVLSHELRTPVTTIYGGAKILARDNALSEEQRREIFEDIHDEAERLHRLVEDVIALNRFGEDQAGGAVGDEPVLLQRILPSVVRAEQVRWPGVTFALEMTPGLPTVVADPTYVEQVVRNLLSNAAKYGGSGTTVRAVVESVGDEVRVQIRDDGPGFPAEEADRLFDLFFRSSSTSSQAPGAGIGLFVTSRLIRAMGGRVWASSPGERGAEFGFALRVMADD
jgi:PAS domain S-box-containing protein